MAGDGVRLDIPISSQSGGKQLSALSGRPEPPKPKVRGLEGGRRAWGAHGQRQPPVCLAPALAYSLPAKRWSRAGSFCSAASEHGSPLEGVPLSSPHSLLDSVWLIFRSCKGWECWVSTPFLLWISWGHRRAEAVLHPRQGWCFSPAGTVIRCCLPGLSAAPSLCAITASLLLSLDMLCASIQVQILLHKLFQLA